MRMTGSIQPAGQSAKNGAVEALRAVLHQVSQIKLKRIDIDSPRPDLKIDILAHIDVHGHSRTLVCKVEASGRPDHVRVALDELQSLAAQLDRDATPVFIAPYLSAEARALCTANRTGFLDLKGNARLDLGEVFIGKCSLPLSARRPSSAAPDRGAQPLEGAA